MPSTTIDPQRAYRAWQSFSTELGVVVRGEILPGSHAHVKRSPTMFVDHVLTAVRDEPNPVDQMVRANDEQNAAEEAQRVAAFEQAAKANRLKLGVRTHRSTRDFFARRNGLPALIQKGSVVVDGDPLLLEFPAVFEPYDGRR